MMRLFISINFDTKTKSEIMRVQDRLRREGSGNFSREENLHLTLAFLGEIDEGRVADIKDAMDAVEIPKLSLTFGEIGFFRQGKDRESQLWWIGIEDNPELSKVQKDLADGLRKKGFQLESRAFKPHITLAREMHLKKWDKRALFPNKFATTSDHMSLMHSHRVDGRLTYTEIYGTGK